MPDGMLPHLLDFNHISIWERARRKHFERGVPFENKTKIARSNRVLSLLAKLVVNSTRRLVSHGGQQCFTGLMPKLVKRR